MTAAPIAIGLCTFRRPGLRATLVSLAATVPGDLVQVLIIADNDDLPTALPQVQAMALPFPVIYLHAPARNISVARNAVLDEAEDRGIRHLAFLDDDEEALPGWLPALVRRLGETGAAAVLGPVRAIYQAGAPDWMRRGGVHDTLPVTGAGGAPMSGYTCNTLLDLAHPSVAGLRFDPARGRTGGEDTAFFHRITAQGGQIAFAPAAQLTEAVPPARARLGWLLQRRFRMGQTHGSLLAEGRRWPARVAQALLALAKALVCLGLYLAGLADPLRRNRALMRMVLHLGVVWQLAGGRRLEPYGSPADPPATSAKSQQ